MHGTKSSNRNDRVRVGGTAATAWFGVGLGGAVLLLLSTPVYSCDFQLNLIPDRDQTFILLRLGEYCGALQRAGRSELVGPASVEGRQLLGQADVWLQSHGTEHVESGIPIAGPLRSNLLKIRLVFDIEHDDRISH